MGDERQSYRVLTWRDGAVEMLDQRVLPQQISYVTCADYRDVAAAVSRSRLRTDFGFGIVVSSTQAPA